MKLDMPRAKTITAVRRDRDAVFELTVHEREIFERAGILRLVLGRVVAAAH
jgi:hypothetical protein